MGEEAGRLMLQAVKVGIRVSEHGEDVTRGPCGNVPPAALLSQDWRDKSRWDCDRDERDGSGLAWSGGKEGSAAPSARLLASLERALVSGLALGDSARAFEYRVPFGTMDIAQSWPFVVFKQVMIPPSKQFRSFFSAWPITNF